jgi:hypothetical protein
VDQVVHAEQEKLLLGHLNRRVMEQLTEAVVAVLLEVQALILVEPVDQV